MLIWSTYPILKRRRSAAANCKSNDRTTYRSHPHLSRHIYDTYRVPYNVHSKLVSALLIHNTRPQLGSPKKKVDANSPLHYKEYMR